MPRICAFYGIVITMYFRDHPPPHFHARYGEHEALVETESLAIIEGSLPPVALRLVREWGVLHRPELAANWSLARARQPLESIDPLP